jgi:peptidoglycan-associated lipoprotein
MNKLKLTLLPALLISLVGCSSTPTGTEMETQGSATVVDPATPEYSGIQTTSLNRSEYLDPMDLTQAENLSQMTSEELAEMEPKGVFFPVIYFGFDQFNITDDSLETIKFYAEILKANPTKTIKISGHTDERGSSGYNLGLGEKRASAVFDAFSTLNIAADRLDTVSFGEEKPALAGSNEEAWAKNRRVELLLK